MIIPSSPRRACCQTFRRARSVICECNTPTLIPKRRSKRPTVCGVRPISGTRISTCLPCLSTGSITCKYTSVLPLPVTPSSKNGTKWLACWLIAAIATPCSVEAVGGVCCRLKDAQSCFLVRRMLVCVVRAFSSSAFNTTFENLVLSSSVASGPCASNAMHSSCFLPRKVGVCASACPASVKVNAGTLSLNAPPLRNRVGITVAQTSPIGW